MGPLFQLIFFGIAYLILAIILGGILFLLFRIAASVFNKNKQAALEAFWLPFKLIPYFLLALICTLIVFTQFREVPPPFVDYWSFELGSGMTVGAVDTPDKWNLWPSPDGGEAIISNIKIFGFDKNAVYGKTETDLNFIYWLPPENNLITLSKTDFESALIKNGWVEKGMKTPADYYYDNRLYGDLATLFLIFIYPLFRLFNVFKILLKVNPKNTNKNVVEEKEVDNQSISDKNGNNFTDIIIHKKSERKSFFIGTIAAAIFILITSSLLVITNFVEFMSAAILVFAPLAAGAITIFFATKEQSNSTKYLILAPWGGLAVWSIVALILAYETWICIVILSPFYAFLSSIGGLIAGWVRRKFCNKTYRGTSASLILFPYLLFPLEGNFGTQTEFIEAESSITIQAPIEKVWEGIQEVPDIKNSELQWTFSHAIGIPKPASACLSSLQVGGLRDIQWQEGIYFKEHITKVIKNELLQYDVQIDANSTALKKLDTHITLGDQYFDVTHGSYSLKPNGDTTILTLKTGYRISTKINFYGKIWANYVFDDFHSSVLNVIKNRIETERSQRC